jgi:hypothetical protein
MSATPHHPSKDPHTSREIVHTPKEGDPDFIYPTVRDEQIARSEAYMAEKIANAESEPEPPPEATRRGR